MKTPDTNGKMKYAPPYSRNPEKKVSNPTSGGTKELRDIACIKFEIIAMIPPIIKE